MSDIKQITKPVTAAQDELKLVFVPCENAEDMLIDGLRFLLEIAARQHQEAA